jgi:hypothetical protein
MFIDEISDRCRKAQKKIVLLNTLKIKKIIQKNMKKSSLKDQKSV